MEDAAPIELDILPQPDDTTCGPTCLQAVYRYFGDEVPLETVVREVPALRTGGTLGILLAGHALRRGYDTRVYTCNLQAFDPTWFPEGAACPDLAERLRLQAACKSDARLQPSTDAWLEYIGLGGAVRMEDLGADVLRHYLGRGIPIVTGLSATWLHRSEREYGPAGVEDDVRGEPTGHFVVLCGYEPRTRLVHVADPLQPNPLAGTHHYRVDIDRAVGAVLLGVLTYDANMLVFAPRGRLPEHHAALPEPDHRQ